DTYYSTSCPTSIAYFLNNSLLSYFFFCVFFLLIRRPLISTLFPYTTLFRSWWGVLLLIQLLSESFRPRCPSIAQAREFFIPIPNGPTRAWKAATRVIASTTARISGNWEAT